METIKTSDGYNALGKTANHKESLTGCQYSLRSTMCRRNQIYLFILLLMFAEYKAQDLLKLNRSLTR